MEKHETGEVIPFKEYAAQLRNWAQDAVDSCLRLGIPVFPPAQAALDASDEELHVAYITHHPRPDQLASLLAHREKMLFAYRREQGLIQHLARLGLS